MVKTWSRCLLREKKECRNLIRKASSKTVKFLSQLFAIHNSGTAKFRYASVFAERGKVRNRKCLADEKFSRFSDEAKPTTLKVMNSSGLKVGGGCRGQFLISPWGGGGKRGPQG
jgi:hypothetical protein